jgi:hypothetical protein
MTTSPPPVSRLSRKCVILDISKPCGPPRKVTGMAVLVYLVLLLVLCLYSPLFYPGPIFSLLTLFAVGMVPWTED